MLRNVKNGICFIAYREEGNIYAAFSFDDTVLEYRETYDYIMKMLNDAFGIQSCIVEPYEITMSQFIENFTEGQRRDYMSGCCKRIIEYVVCSWRCSRL